jgi:hypothetical protein
VPKRRDAKLLEVLISGLKDYPNSAASARARCRSNVRRCIPFGRAGNGSSKSTPPPSLILIFRAWPKRRCKAVCCWLS